MKALLAVTLFGAALASAETPASADALLAEAKGNAASGNRAIFLTFHASW
ncbi:MAG TPA: hypothetical protein VMJ75_10300 [Candidatus Acidoferrales bacterium]|nr:hypothetical protein [Candidatus Acidoferrales bacterium]